MFDDVQPPKPGATPPNLPLGEPEDIFERNDVVESNDSAPISEPSPDSTSPVLTNTALDMGVLKPKNSLQTTSTPVQSPVFSSESSQLNPPAPLQNYTIQAPPAPFLAEERGMAPTPAGVPQEAPFSGRKILMIIAVLVIVVLIGFGSLWIYTSFIKKNIDQNNFISPVITPTSSSSDFSDTPVEESLPVNSTSTNIEDSILFGEPVDTDNDGILDIHEVEYGTDTLNWDTDQDALSDGDEVSVWNTDPLTFDTDGDGYSDGVEVKNGYKPTGPGKLFDPPTQTSTPKATTTSM